MRKTGLYALGLLVISLLLLGVVVPVLAAQGGAVQVQVDHSGAESVPSLVDQPVTPPPVGGVDPATGNSPTSLDVKPYQPGTPTDQKHSWWKDHGKGLLLGLAEGIGIAVGVVAIGLFLPIAAPVLAAAAVGAVAGSAVYGAISGASKFNPWECAINGVIGAVSGGVGASLGVAATGAKALVVGAVDTIGSGCASAANYGFNTPTPTAGGYLTSFGAGAVIGAATFGLGRAASATGLGEKLGAKLRLGRKVAGTGDAGSRLKPAVRGTVAETLAKEERAAVETAIPTNSQITNRLGGTVGPDAGKNPGPRAGRVKGEGAGQKAISRLETTGEQTGESLEATILTPPPASNKYWTFKTQFEGKTVYQRDDLIDPNLVDDLGWTNAERMQEGYAPIGPDGKLIQLHHMIQTDSGGIAEVTTTMHRTNYSILHVNPNKIPSGIGRPSFDSWRERYWANRALDFPRE